MNRYRNLFVFFLLLFPLIYFIDNYVLKDSMHYNFLSTIAYYILPIICYKVLAFKSKDAAKKIIYPSLIYILGITLSNIFIYLNLHSMVTFLFEEILTLLSCGIIIFTVYLLKKYTE